jgi:hypothetical protein
MGGVTQNKNDPICVALPKVAKASKKGNIASRYCWHYTEQTLPVYTWHNYK